MKRYYKGYIYGIIFASLLFCSIIPIVSMLPKNNFQSGLMVFLTIVGISCSLLFLLKVIDQIKKDDKTVK